MDSSNVVAGLSVLVTGVVSPLIAATTTRWQLRRTVDSTFEAERRSALDAAVIELAKFMRSNGHVMAFWRIPRFPDDPQVQEQMRNRSLAAEGVVAAYGRICIRFGVSSGVAQSYLEADLCIDRFNTLLRDFRAEVPYDTRRELIEVGYQELSTVRDRFLGEAHKAYLGLR